MWVSSTCFPSSAGLCQRSLFLAPSRVLSCELHDWWVGRGREIRHSEGIRGIGIPLTISLTISQTSLRSLHTSCWGCFAGGCPSNGPQTLPMLWVLHFLTPHPVARSVCVLLMVVRESFGRQLVQKTGLNQPARERPQTWALALPLEKQKGGYRHWVWDMAGLREGI